MFEHDEAGIADAVPPPIWRDEEEKQTLLRHPSGRGAELAPYLDERLVAVAAISEQLANELFYELGSIQWLRGEPFEEKARLAFTREEMQEWRQKRDSQEGLALYEMPRNLSAGLSEKIGTMRATALQRMYEIWQSLTEAEKAAVLFLTGKSRETFVACLSGTFCVMIMGRALLIAYNTWAEVKGKPKIVLPTL